MADTSIFSKLKRLFSTNTIVRNVGGKQLRIADTDQIQSFVNRRGVDRYHRVYNSATGGYGSSHGRYEAAAAFQGARLQLFRDYDMMDNDPIISSVMDIYADESTIKNEFGKILTIKTDNSQIQQVLDNLFYDVLNIEFNLWPWTRNMVKYGDFFLYMDIDSDYGIVNVIPLSVYETIRIEGEEAGNPFSVRFEVQNDFLQLGKKDFDNYEVAHFRLLADTNFLPYGKCLPKTAYVDTEHGAQTIDTLVPGQRVWVWNGKSFELSPIKHVVESGKKQIMEITTSHHTLQSSGNHPILIWNTATNSTEYKLAENIKLGDLVVVSANTHLANTPCTVNKHLGDGFNKNEWKNKIELIPDTFTEEFSQLFGFLIGDGWISPDGTISFAQGVDHDLNSKYTQLLEKFGGNVVRYTKQTYTDEKIPAHAMLSSKMLATVLANNGFVGSSYTKRVPSWVFNSPKEIQLAFIRGLVDADGSVNVDKWGCSRYSLEVANEMLVRDVQHLLRRMNIKVGKVCTRTRTEVVIKNNKVKNISPSYYIYFYLDGEEVAQIKKYDVGIGENVLTEPVTRLSLLDIQDTYDIQVESEHSNFIANGIVVHNSMVEGGRRVWKQLQLMEDAMLVHRIMRAPDKRKFKIDIGNIPPAEVENYMQKMIERMKKTPLVDPKTGDYNLRYNMMNITEDFYLPVRGKDSGTEIETMQGLQFNAIEDIEYLRNKLMAAFKVPKAFLGYEEDLSGKATLAAQDVRFARTIERIQRILVSELTKIAIVHLYVQGFRDQELVNFELSLANSSTLYEQEKINIWRDRFGLAQQITGGQAVLLSQDWVYSNILEMSEDEIANERKRIEADNKRLQQQQMAAQPPMGGMPGMPGEPAPDTGEPPPGAETGDEQSPIDAVDTGDTTDQDSSIGQEPSPDEVADGEETQIDDVEQILASLKDLDAADDDSADEEELDELLAKKRVGRPREGIKFGTDAHHYGRDPLGNRENKKSYRRAGLSLETKSFLAHIDKHKPSKYKQFILESSMISKETDD
jgi:hypothetical protein